MSKEAMKLALEALEKGKYYAKTLMMSQEPFDAAIKVLAEQPARQQEPNGIEFLMRGDKMAFKIGVQQFTLDYEPVEPGEFEFMRDALLNAISTFTPDVKTGKPAQQEPVAHCEAGPEHCPVCLAETRSLALAAAIGYIQRNTPKLVSEEICMALGKISPPASKPLTDEQWQIIADTLGCIITRSQKEIIEAALGIKENT